MTKQTIEVPDVYKIVEEPSIKHFGSGDYYLVKIEKIPQRRIVLEETDELMGVEYLTQNIVLTSDADKYARIEIQSKYVWREVKETDLSLNSDEARIK